MDNIQFSSQETAFAFELFYSITKNEQFALTPSEAKEFLLEVNLNQESLKTVFTRFFKGEQQFTLYDFAKLLRLLAAQEHMDVLTFSDAEVEENVLQLPEFELVELRPDSASLSNSPVEPSSLSKRGSCKTIDKENVQIDYLRSQLEGTNMLAYVFSSLAIQNIEEMLDNIEQNVCETFATLTTLLHEPSEINIDPIEQLAKASAQIIFTKIEEISEQVENCATEMAETLEKVDESGLKELYNTEVALEKHLVNNLTKDSAIIEFNKDLTVINEFASHYCAEAVSMTDSDASGQKAALFKRISSLRDEREDLLQRLLCKMHFRYQEGIVQGYYIGLIELVHAQMKHSSSSDDFWNTNTRE